MEENKATVQETSNAENKTGVINETARAAQDNKVTEDLLRELIALQKKETGHAKRTSFFMACFVIIILVVVLVLVPKLMGTLNQLQNTIVQAQDTITQAQGTITKLEGELENVSGMVKSITTTSDNVNGMLEENTESLNSAIKDITEIDFAGLNNAIKDLQDAIKPFADLMRRF